MPTYKFSSYRKPLLEVAIYNLERTKYVIKQMLIDTGATVDCFDISIPKQLGYPIATEPNVPITGVHGMTVKGWEHDYWIGIIDRTKLNYMREENKISFLKPVERIRVVSIPNVAICILGHESFFRNYIIKDYNYPGSFTIEAKNTIGI